MVTPELLAYIKLQAQGGVNQEQLRAGLIASGWTTEDIHEAYVAAGMSSTIGNTAPQSSTAPLQPHKYAFMAKVIVIILVMAIGGTIVYFYTSNPKTISPTEIATQSPSLPSSKILLDDKVLTQDKKIVALYVSEKAENAVVYLTATSGHVQIIANGELSPVYDQLLAGISTSADQRLVISPASRLKKSFVVVNGKESRPYDSILNGPSLSPDGKHYAFVATAQGKRIYVLDGTEIEKELPPTLSNPGMGYSYMTFSGDSKKITFSDGSVDGVAQYRIFDVEKQSLIKKITSKYPGNFVPNGNVDVVAYIDGGDVVVWNKTNEVENEKRFPLGLKAVSATLVVSGDGKHWAGFITSTSNFPNAELFIDGKKVIQVSSGDVIYDTLMFDPKGEKVTFTHIKKPNPGQKVYDISGVLLSDQIVAGYTPAVYAFNDDGALVGWLEKDSSGPIEMVLMQVGGKEKTTTIIQPKENVDAPKDAPQTILTVDGKRSTMSLEEFRKILESRSAQIKNHEYELYFMGLESAQDSNILNTIQGPDKKITATVRQDTFTSKRRYVQVGNASTSNYQIVATPLINENNNTISFGAISGSQILLEVYEIVPPGNLMRQPVSDSAPLARIEEKKVYGSDAKGDIKGTPAESSIDVDILPAYLGVQVDINFVPNEGSRAIVTVSLDGDMLGSVYEGDVTGTTTAKFAFPKKYSGNHKLILRVEPLNKSVRSNVGLSNIRFVGLK